MARRGACSEDSDGAAGGCDCIGGVGPRRVGGGTESFGCSAGGGGCTTAVWGITAASGLGCEGAEGRIAGWVVCDCGWPLCVALPYINHNTLVQSKSTIVVREAKIARFLREVTPARIVEECTGDAVPVSGLPLGTVGRGGGCGVVCCTLLRVLRDALGFSIAQRPQPLEKCACAVGLLAHVTNPKVTRS
jgi:hypothetical protein